MSLKTFTFCAINCIVKGFLLCILFSKIKNKDLNEGTYNCKLILLDLFQIAFLIDLMFIQEKIKKTLEMLRK